MNRLEGKTALITGTAGGQGRAAAIMFAQEGARVIGCDMKVAENEETTRMVRSAGGQMESIAPLDLSDHTQVASWVQFALDTYGDFDILYNNASRPVFAPLMDMTNEMWHDTMKDELDLVFYATRAVWPIFIKRGGGVVINTASVAGLTAFLDNHSAHAAAKGAVIALTRQLASEGAPHNIRVNSISPGPVLTPATALALPTEEARRELGNITLLKRVGMPEDIAYLALYLASDESTWMTGSNIIIDGGFTAV